jgi:hypothetical protein
LSPADRRRTARLLFTALILVATGSLGCWEQWSNDWFPQMKRQRAVQAFEDFDFEGQRHAFSPPEGSVPIDGGEAPVSNLIDEASDHLLNPQSRSLASLENGRRYFERYCATCHGGGGLGDGPVSMMGSIQGPFAAVLPVAGPASIARVRSDGHIYTTIRYGRRRMPGYGRIPAEDRWDIVNYIRYLNEQKGIVP